jgi:hypothetical protein
MNKILCCLLLSLFLCGRAAEHEIKTFKSGYTDIRSSVAAASLENGGSSAQFAFPWARRMVWVKFDQVESCSRIELKLERIRSTAEENKANLSGLEVYGETEDVLPRILKHEISHRKLIENGRVFDLVTISGSFSGKVLKLYQPWSSQEQTFGFSGLKDNIRVFSEKKIHIEPLKMAPVSNREIKVELGIKGGSPTGEFRITLDPDNRVVFQKNAAELMNDAPIFLRLTLPELPAGVKTLTVEYRESGALLSSQQVRFRLSDTPEPLPVREGKTEIPAGTYAVYLEIMGTEPVKIRDESGNTLSLKLDTWHPEDLSPQLRGEVCALVRHFTRPETLQVISGAPIAVRIQEVSSERAAIWNAPPEIVPATIIHDDGYSAFFTGQLQTREDFRELLAGLSRTPLYAYDWCVGVTTTVNYPSKFASNFGWNGIFWREGDHRAAVAVNRLISDGNDPVKSVGEFCDKYGVRYSLTLRANATYPSRSSGMNGKFYHDNPHLRQSSADGRRGIRLSYAYPEVRQFLLQLIGEMVAYKPDAIVIEFMRHPPFFGYDEPLIETYRKRHGSCTPADFMNADWQAIQCEIMDEFMAQVRQTINASSHSTALEVSFDCAKYYEQGLNIERWLSRGYIDMISPGTYGVGERKFFPMQPFVRMIQASPRRCLLFPRVEATIIGQDPTPDEEKGLVEIRRKKLSVNMFKELFIRFRADGADGLRPFNTNSPELARVLADRSLLKRFEEFEMPMLDIRHIEDTEPR